MKRIRHKPKYDLVDIVQTSMQFPNTDGFAVLQKHYAEEVIKELERLYELENGREVLGGVLRAETEDIETEAARELNRLYQLIDALPGKLAAHLDLSPDEAHKLAESMGIPLPGDLEVR